MKIRIFGAKDGKQFWKSKPLQEGNLSYKEKIKWYHIHWYNIPYNPVHKSPNGIFKDILNNVILYKCRCGKPKPKSK